MPQTTNLTSDERQALLAEYQAAQASAEHHEYMGWLSKGLLWAANMILLGYVATSELKPIVTSIVAACGVVLLISQMVFWDALLTRVKCKKYARCKKIEEMFTQAGTPMEQHTIIDDCVWPKGYLAKRAWLLIGFFILAWGALVAVAWIHGKPL